MFASSFDRLRMRLFLVLRGRGLQALGEAVLAGLQALAHVEAMLQAANDRRDAAHPVEHVFYFRLWHIAGLANIEQAAGEAIKANFETLYAAKTDNRMVHGPVPAVIAGFFYSKHFMPFYGDGVRAE